MDFSTQRIEIKLIRDRLIDNLAKLHSERNTDFNSNDESFFNSLEIPKVLRVRIEKLFFQNYEALEILDDINQTNPISDNVENKESEELPGDVEAAHILNDLVILEDLDQTRASYDIQAETAVIPDDFEQPRASNNIQAETVLIPDAIEQLRDSNDKAEIDDLETTDSVDIQEEIVLIPDDLDQTGVSDNKHSNHVANPKVICCQNCEKVFLSTESLIKHEKTIHANENDRVVEISDEEILTKESHRAHIIFAKCKFCDIFVSNISNHDNRFHMRTTKLIFCQSCPAAFTSIQALLEHVERRHPSSKTCFDCKQKTEAYQVTTTHACKICSKYFTSFNKLELHSMKHQRKCRSCGKLFVSKNSDSYELNTKRKVCHICGQHYKIEKLKLHMCIEENPQHTNNDTDKSTTLCVSCGKLFKEQKELEKHLCEAKVIEEANKDTTQNLDVKRRIKAMINNLKAKKKEKIHGEVMQVENNFKASEINPPASLCVSCGTFKGAKELEKHFCEVQVPVIEELGKNSSTYEENEEIEPIPNVDVEEELEEAVIDIKPNKLPAKNREKVHVEVMQVEDNFIAFVADEHGVVNIDFCEKIDLTASNSKEDPLVIMFDDNGDLIK